MRQRLFWNRAFLSAIWCFGTSSASPEAGGAHRIQPAETMTTGKRPWSSLPSFGAPRRMRRSPPLATAVDGCVLHREGVACQDSGGSGHRPSRVTTRGIVARVAYTFHDDQLVALALQIQKPDARIDESARLIEVQRTGIWPIWVPVEMQKHPTRPSSLFSTAKASALHVLSDGVWLALLATRVADQAKAQACSPRIGTGTGRQGRDRRRIAGARWVGGWGQAPARRTHRPAAPHTWLVRRDNVMV